MRTHKSIRGFVGPSVGPLVRWSVHWSVEVIELKSGKMSVLDTLLFMYVCVWSGVWGVDRGWMPLPTRPG